MTTSPNEGLLRRARSAGVLPAEQSRRELSALIERRDPEPTRCAKCEEPLVDDGGSSWPYCPVCDWCPDCGTAHPSRNE